MVSKNYRNIPSQTCSWRSYCSAATGTASFCLLSSWHGCVLQSTVGIASKTGTAVGLHLSFLSLSSEPTTSTLFYSRMEDVARRCQEAWQQRIPQQDCPDHTYFCWTEPRYSLALLTLQHSPVKCSSRFQGSLLTGSVHFIPPFS